ncbi:SusD family protein [Pedobacter steynii]|uniref:SusD family protein n=1 Tax=Pedobacter steynii TaxID=430522 RepID=A0A1H0HKW9_9SPHI|nr:RagB/SusD family nutrient uptake outer membrane protein [Pedobacter steynii]NQX42580.1 RagB/SusD family nutrient uptake outer membrane protein [Pedobacter steynii]SDO19848.1 SusD family protein [Pedobacter steynii]
MKRITYLFSALILITGLASCKKWLDVSPGTQVQQEAFYSTEAGFNQALMGSYVKMERGLYADNLTMTTLSAMGQNYQTSLTGNSFLEHAKYNYSAPAVKDTIKVIWSKMYTAIAGVNNILDHVETSKSVLFKNHYNIVKGEALGLRAFLHFDLLRMFGPMPATGGNTAAIPYIKTFGKTITPLSTTNAVISACLADLDEAESLLTVNKEVLYANDDRFISYTRNHFNYWAVKALKARIYLYKGDKIKAAQYANELISSEKFPFVSRSTFNQSANQDRTFSTEHIFALQVPLLKDMVDRRFRLEGVPSYQTSTLYLSTATVNSLYETQQGGTTDYRYLYNIRTYTNVSYTTKYWQDGLTNLEIAKQVPLIRLSEMYYIAAEASPDLGQALQLINKIRTQRGLENLNITLDENRRMAEIEKEYVKEFYGEGQLFFFYKRLERPGIPRSTVAMTNLTYTFPLPDDETEFGNR